MRRGQRRPGAHHRGRIAAAKRLGDSVRIVIAAALVAATAACAWPVLPPPPQAAVRPAPPPPAAAAIVAAPPAPALVPIAVVVPRPVPDAQPSAITYDVYNNLTPLVWFEPFSLRLGLQPGRLTLSNFRFDLVDVEAVITRSPDCAVLAGTAPIDFKLALNATWVVPAPPGADVCWRRQTKPPPIASAAAAASGWTPWNRVYTSTGRSIDARL